MIFAHCEVSRRSRLRITFWYISGNTVVYKYCLDTDTVVLFCSSLFVLLLLVLITWSVPQPTLLVSTWVLSLHTHGLHGLFTWFTWFTWLPFSTSSIRQNQIKWLKSPLDGVFKGFKAIICCSEKSKQTADIYNLKCKQQAIIANM